MGLLDELTGMGYAVRHVTPVKLTDAGCLTDVELDELRAIEGEERDDEPYPTEAETAALVEAGWAQ